MAKIHFIKSDVKVALFILFYKIRKQRSNIARFIDKVAKKCYNFCILLAHYKKEDIQWTILT